MARRSNKRGLVAPPHAAALSALDFAAATQAFRRALEMGDCAKGDAKIDATAEVISETADRLLSIPVATAADIAVKVEAYAWLHTISHDMREPAARRRIAEGDDDRAKGLLAIYLDLTSLSAPTLPPPQIAPSAEVSAFALARSNFETLEAEQIALFKAEREGGEDLANEELDRLNAERTETLWSAMLAPSPDLDALSWKLARGLDVAHAEYVGESAEDSAFISRLLGERSWDAGCIPAIAYQDVLRLAGRSSPVTEAKPERFDAGEFLSGLKRDFGAIVLLTEDGTPAIQTVERPSNIVGAAARFDGLSNAQQWIVRNFLLRAGQ